MIYPTIELAEGLRKAASQLRQGAFYAWGHHGACNCGHLLQVTMQLSKEEILTWAHTGHGEWTEIAEEACSVTGAPVTLLLTKLEQLGLTPTDIHNIEYLEDREVLNHLPGGFRWLQRNNREDVIVYFETMADLIEEKLANIVQIEYDDLLSPIENEDEISLLQESLEEYKANPSQTEDWKVFKNRMIHQINKSY